MDYTLLFLTLAFTYYSYTARVANLGGLFVILIFQGKQKNSPFKVRVIFDCIKICLKTILSPQKLTSKNGGSA